VHIGLDVWTDIKLTPWLGVVVYFIFEGRYKHFTLDFVRLRGSHTGAYLSEVVNDCLVKYNLQKRLLTVVTDNASNNDTMVDHLQRRIGPTGRFRGQQTRQRCFAHILNLVQHAFLQPFTRTKQSKPDPDPEVTEQWEELSEQMKAIKDEDDGMDDNDDNFSTASIRDLSDDEVGDDTEDDERVDTDFDSDRFAQDTSLVDEFEDIDKCVIDSLNTNIELPPLTVLDRKEACMLLSKVFFLFLFIYFLFIHCP
jgi:hypothetical protein